MQWNSPLVHNRMPQDTINSSCSSIGNWVSCLHNWLLFANAINYSQLSQLIALRNQTNPGAANRIYYTWWLGMLLHWSGHIHWLCKNSCDKVCRQEADNREPSNAGSLREKPCASLCRLRKPLLSQLTSKHWQPSPPISILRWPHNNLENFELTGMSSPRWQIFPALSSISTYIIVLTRLCKTP